MNDSANQDAAAKSSWWHRLTTGLKRTSASIGGAISDLVSKRKLDAGTIEELEELLIRADLGVATAAKVAAAVGGRPLRHGGDGRRGEADPRGRGREDPGAGRAAAGGRSGRPAVRDPGGRRQRLGQDHHDRQARRADSAARAARSCWRRATPSGPPRSSSSRSGERAPASPVVASSQGADSAALAFEALEAARAQAIDVLIVDTAGRLQNKAALMGELEKIVRVMKKLDPGAPHAVLLVLDATVGPERAVAGRGVRQDRRRHRPGDDQARRHRARRHPGGDRGQEPIPVHFIGVGESVDDLAPFAAKDFARAIAGIET